MSDPTYKAARRPWIVESTAEGRVVITSECRDVCVMENYYQDAEANAKLIVEAVNEYDALTEISRCAARIAHECVPNSDKNMPALRDLWRAQAVLVEIIENRLESVPR